MHNDVILGNIAARKAAEALVELITETAAAHSGSADSFWRVLVKAVPIEYIPKVASGVKAMTDREARLFENVAMPWGGHKGRRVRDVPVDYLTAVSGPSAFVGDIRRYLLSNRLQQEQEEAVTDD